MSVFLLELRNLRRSMISSTMSFCVITFSMLLFYPSMQTESMKALAGAKLEGIDPALLEVLGLTHLVDFTIITNFFGYVLQFTTLAIMVVVTQRAVALLCKEETDGTIEYLCSKPISRWQIFTQKVLAHLVGLLILILTLFATTIAGYLLVTTYTFQDAVKESFIFYGSMCFVGLLYSAIGVLLSALSHGGKSVGGVSIAVVFGTFLLGIASVLIKDLDFLIWLSPMDWIKTHKLMTEGILLSEWIVGCTVIVLCFVSAWLQYRRKDLLV